MMELTKERLQEIAEDGFLKHGEAKAMARQLLAGIEQEPVAFIARYESGAIHGTCDRDDPVKMEWLKRGMAVSPLYAAPQLPQPAVTELEQFAEFMAAEYIKSGDYPDGWQCKASNAAHEYSQACRAAMLQGAEPVSQPNTLPGDTLRLDWLDAQNKRLNDYYGTAYGWKFDANFQRNAMMLNDSNYPVMTVRQAIDEAIAAAPQQEAK